MKLVFYSPNFHPMVGGLETAVLELALGCTERGHQVTVLTRTPAAETDTFPFPVVRQPGFGLLVRHIRQSDVFVQFNVSLKGIVPWLFARRPLVLVHQGLYEGGQFTDLLKRLVCYVAAVNTGCSRYIAQRVPRGQWLPNPYDDTCFRPTGNVAPTHSIVFAGRLVSEKGGHVLLNALHRLKHEYALCPALTIVGDGPERQALAEQAQRLGIAAQVMFAGVQRNAALAAQFGRNRIAVVPSIYQEPFGIVALEAMACGCYVIGSHVGGLPEAIGPGGRTVEMNNADALATALADALRQPPSRPDEAVAAHLAAHTRAAIANRFLTILAPYA